MIDKMEAVCIVAQNSRKEELLSSLRELGILHVAQKKEADAELLERFSMLSRLSLELKDYTDDSKSDADTLSDEQFENMYQDTISALENINILNDRLTNLRLEVATLKPWGDFNPKMIKSLPNSLNFHFYRLDKKDFKELLQSENIKFIRLASVEKMETVAVLGELDASFNGIEFIIHDKGISEINDEIKKCEDELIKCKKTLSNAAKHLKSYSEQLLKTKNDTEYSSVKQTLEQSGELIWIKGYIPKADKEKFSVAAKEQGWAFAIGDIEDGDVDVPTKISYGKTTALIKPIFDILGIVPGYKEYDISFWFLSFFALFFAMIIGDAGYGLLFLLGTALFHIKTKKVTNIILLLYLLSGTTIAWGAVTGTWFGHEAAMNIPILKALVIPSIANYPQYFSISSAQVQNNVMKFCFSIGVIQLALACIMNIKRKISCKSLSWLADLGWLLAICALYFLVLFLVVGEEINITIVAGVVGVGFLMVVLFGGMEADKTFVQGLKSGLGNAFTVFLNTISAFGNIMSYIRLFAVGMASLAIAQSFNDMSSGFDGVLVVVGAVIMIIGHILNIVMGFLSVVVHGVRLNLLEFSGQLGMEWSGVAYNPFRKLKK